MASSGIGIHGPGLPMPTTTLFRTVMTLSELPTTWGDLATYCLPPVSNNFDQHEDHNIDPYVDLFPPLLRPSYVTHDSSITSRIRQAFTDFLGDHGLTDTPIPYPVLVVLESLRIRKEPQSFLDKMAIYDYAQRFVNVLDILLTELDPTIRYVLTPSSELLHGGYNLQAVTQDEERLTVIALDFEAPHVLQHYLPDLLRGKALNQGSLSDGSALAMKMALHLLDVSKGSSHHGFGVLFTGATIVFSELCHRPDGSIVISLSDSYRLRSTLDSQSIPLIGILTSLLLPKTAEKIRPTGVITAELYPKSDKENNHSTPVFELGLPTILEARSMDASPVSQKPPIKLSFSQPNLSPKSRSLFPCSFFSTSPDTPVTLSMLPPFTSSNNMDSTENIDYLWDFGPLDVQRRAQSPLPAAKNLADITLVEPLRRPYDMTWRGTAKFLDGSVRSVIAKMARRTHFLGLAREAHIYDVLTSRSDTIAPTYYGSYILEDDTAAMIILDDGGTHLKGIDGWQRESLEGLTTTQAKNILRCLDGLHIAGFLHNDFVSRNVVIDEKGDVRIIDFGHSERHTCPGRKKCGELREARKDFLEIRPDLARKHRKPRIA